MIIETDQYNNSVIDGKGQVLYGNDILSIKTNKPKNITIKNFNIYGSVRIYGMGKNGQNEVMRESSRNPDHVIRCREAAPSNITFENIQIFGNGRIPFYVAPGATNIRLYNSYISGYSNATAIYLGAETANVEISNNIIDTKVKRELLAIDASEKNIIRNNKFNNVQYGGIFLYRNSGEGGTIRYTSPSDNVIENNIFEYKFPYNLLKFIIPTIWVGSRSRFMQYFYAYRNDDAGYPFGSSITNCDLAERNIIVNNKNAFIRDWGLS